MSQERSSCLASTPASLGTTGKTHETLQSPLQTRLTNILWLELWFLLVPAYSGPKAEHGAGVLAFLADSCIPQDWCEISVEVPS